MPNVFCLSYRLPPHHTIYHHHQPKTSIVYRQRQDRACTLFGHNPIENSLNMTFHTKPCEARNFNNLYARKDARFVMAIGWFKKKNNDASRWPNRSRFALFFWLLLCWALWPWRHSNVYIVLDIYVLGLDVRQLKLNTFRTTFFIGFSWENISFLVLQHIKIIYIFSLLLLLFFSWCFRKWMRPEYPWPNTSRGSLKLVYYHRASLTVKRTKAYYAHSLGLSNVSGHVQVNFKYTRKTNTRIVWCHDIGQANSAITK